MCSNSNTKYKQIDFFFLWKQVSQEKNKNLSAVLSENSLCFGPLFVCALQTDRHRRITDKKRKGHKKDLMKVSARDRL